MRISAVQMSVDDLFRRIIEHFSTGGSTKSSKTRARRAWHAVHHGNGTDMSILKLDHLKEMMGELLAMTSAAYEEINKTLKYINIKKRIETPEIENIKFVTTSQLKEMKRSEQTRRLGHSPRDNSGQTSRQSSAHLRSNTPVSSSYTLSDTHEDMHVQR
eukprot:GHVR01173221.1.p1 GENE.GHVR01173221.1~~GHVR01173221.1.p1  ORF type:complete len:159 (+),score=43.68 GHVR01173221.1:213-689(+)